MRRWLPHPWLALALLSMWLLLNQSLSPGHVLVGSAVAILASHGLAALRMEPVRFAAIRPIFKLTGLVLVDIVRSNLAVARIILFSKRERVSAFVRVPLELRNINGLAALAIIITATPGTMWIQFNRNSGILLVHVLDLIDEEGWVSLIKGRYEALLLEIFGA